jgi:membrane fusion protein (multidrug efflux system)
MTFRQLFKKYVFIIIPGAIVILAALVIGKDLLTPRATVPRMPANVTLFEVKETEVKNSWEVTGVLEASSKVELVARVSGFLEKKSFLPGKPVTKGTELFLIEPRQYEAALDAAKGNYQAALAQQTQAKLSFDRTSDLYAKRSSPKSDYDNAKAALDTADAAVLSTGALLKQAELNLEYARIIAPFDGLVTDSSYSEGAYVGPSSGVLATIVSSDPVEVSFGIPDRLMADLRFGSKDSPLPRGRTDSLIAKVKINGQFIYDTPGTVSYVSPLVDRGTSTIMVKTVFSNPEGLLVPGESASVILEDSLPRKTFLIPKNAILQSSTVGSFVYVASPAKEGEGLVAEIRPIKIGLEFPQGIESLEGLSPGDRIIEIGLMSGGAMLRPGSPINVISGYDPKATPGTPGGAGSSGSSSGASTDPDAAFSEKASEGPPTIDVSEPAEGAMGSLGDPDAGATGAGTEGAE